MSRLPHERTAGAPAGPAQPIANLARGAVRASPRHTPLSTRGEPMVWVTGICLAVCLLMIAALLGAVVINGSLTFWPRPIHQVTLRTGEVFLGQPTRQEAYEPGDAATAEIERMLEAGEIDPDGLALREGLPVRRLYRIGNRDIGTQSFRWAPLYEVASIETPADAVVLERLDWGVFTGVPEAILRIDRVPAPDGAAEGSIPAETSVEVEGLGLRRAEQRLENGEIVRRVYLVEGAEDTWAMLRERLPDARARYAKIQSLSRRLGHEQNAAAEEARLRLRKAERRHAMGEISDERLAAEAARFEEAREQIRARSVELTQHIDELRAQDDRYRLLIRDPNTGRFAPTAQSEPDSPLRMSQVVRAVRPNTLSLAGKLRVYFDRWGEFVLGEPRDANQAGGVFPVIVSTALLTILLSIAVVPLGVIAALYLREYAKQGLVVSTVRIAVNNLAGVPSIVYGVFGLGFFCYTVGRWVDGGPQEPWQPGLWFGLVGALVALVLVSLLATRLSKPVPGKPVTSRHRLIVWASVLLWTGSVALLVMLIAKTPFFRGFFWARLLDGQPTFGAKGLLWSALTLALLTLPVVIVATEEAIAAVPKSMREGSFGCGASRWQTIYRIVLPRAAPGIMTGMILAMARGAGEVAPLMLVGAVKLQPELPIQAEWPFIHLERTFMHLGFHIFDVGFQSPDSEATRPIAWTTTLLLIVLIALLNLAAIALRARLRRRFQGGAF